MNFFVKLKKNEDKRARQGYLWIFSNELETLPKDIENGEIVEAVDNDENFIAKCFYNKNSLISLRILSYDKNFDFEERFQSLTVKAYNFRKLLYPDSECFRMIFSESDFLPGLIVDKYEDVLVVQINSAGMEKRKKFIIDNLARTFSVSTILLKSDDYFRKLEGLSKNDDEIFGEAKNKIIKIDDIKYKIDFEKGQKTGFYYDQRENRKYIREFCEGKKVLDLFCNSGGFGLNASKAGASEVCFVDVSQKEIELAKFNFELNNLKSKAEFIKCDAFDYLNQAVSQKIKYDAAIIDPPSFVKNKKNLPLALKAYEKLYRKSLQIVKDDGIVCFASCSHHLNENMFKEVVLRAVKKEKKILREIRFLGAAPDHPKLITMPETSYLKFGVYQVFSL